MIPYLDLRAKLALSRVLLTVDYDAGLLMADECLLQVATLAFETPGRLIPWPVRGEPAMVVAFQEGAKRGARHRVLQARCEARRAEEVSAAAKRRSERLAESERTISSVPELPERLQAGEEVKVNGYSLSWDSIFDGLTGTNAYGMDYFWSHEMTLSSIEAWRNAMIAGRVLGPCPPGEDDDDPGCEASELEKTHWSDYILHTDGLDLWTPGDWEPDYTLHPRFVADLAYDVFCEENRALVEDAMRSERAFQQLFNTSTPFDAISLRIASRSPPSADEQPRG